LVGLAAPSVTYFEASITDSETFGRHVEVFDRHLETLAEDLEAFDRHVEMIG
jgi:hypothetical protein